MTFTAYLKMLIGCLPRWSKSSNGRAKVDMYLALVPQILHLGSQFISATSAFSTPQQGRTSEPGAGSISHGTRH